MLDRAHTIEVRFGQVYQDPSQHRAAVPLSRPVAWFIVVTFFVAILAMVAAPFVGQGYRVVTGMTAGLALIAFFGAVGAVKASRKSR